MLNLEKKSFHVVLFEPEIPNNTGNIGRTCVGTNSTLHLVGKLGFEIDDKRLKRAGLDYWPHLEWTHHHSWDEFWEQVPDVSRVFFLTKKATEHLYQHQFQQGDWFVFGKETKGLPQELLQKYQKQCLQIPILGPIRSYNLANSVSTVVFEALRQVGIP